MNVVIFSSIFNLNEFGYLVFTPLVLGSFLILRQSQARQYEVVMFKDRMGQALEALNLMKAVIATICFATWLAVVFLNPGNTHSMSSLFEGYSGWSLVWVMAWTILPNTLPLVMWLPYFRRHATWSLLMLILAFGGIQEEIVMYTNPLGKNYFSPNGWNHTNIDSLNNISLYLFLYTLCFAAIYWVLERARKSRAAARKISLYE
jgi:hypothetical protein